MLHICVCVYIYWLANISNSVYTYSPRIEANHMLGIKYSLLLRDVFSPVRNRYETEVEIVGSRAGGRVALDKPANCLHLGFLQ